MLKNLAELIKDAQSKESRKMAVAAAHDEPVLVAVNNAMKEGLIIPILVGIEEEIRKMAAKIKFDLSTVQIINEEDETQACKTCIKLIRDGEADILMKGLVSTSKLLKPVLDKEKGLRKGAVLSHIAFADIPSYHKILAITDAGMNPSPDFNQKVEIVKNAVEAFHRLGVKNPKVAVVAAVETVNPKMECTVHAAMLTMMNKRKQINGCIIEGPFGFDNAINKEACEHKKIETEVGGDADIILCPDIEAGNILYKSINFLAGATTGAVIMGAKVPIVLTSRADTDKSKFMSIAYAAAMD
jgi:phosphate butyryltransferase